MHSDLERLELPVLGVSPQGQDSHQRFAQQYDLPFPLLVDADKRVIRDYGVDGPMGFGVRRVTYLIGPDQIIQASMKAAFRVKNHLDFLSEFIARHNA